MVPFFQQKGPFWSILDAAYGKELSWLHFINDPRVQEGQLVNNQQYYITSHENKKVLSSFYHKNIFDRK